MKNTQHLTDLAARPKLRLSEIERLIRMNRIIVPVPSRRALIMMCEDGTFETAPRRRTGGAYLVYEDSFLRWIKALDESLGDEMKAFQ